MPNLWRKNRVVMTFSFTGITRAHEMADKLKELGHASKIGGTGGSWTVTTDTGAMEHAAELVQFLGEVR